MTKSPVRSRISRLFSRLIPDAAPVEAGLKKVNARLGRGRSEDAEDRTREAVRVHATESMPRTLYYAPSMDGQAEPGEVVFIWTPSDGPDQPLRERAMLIVGHDRDTALGLLISPNSQHEGDERWVDIGTGDWDRAGRPCWGRLDRVLEVSDLGIRRRGILFPRRRFDRVAAKLRSQYGWN